MMVEVGELIREVGATAARAIEDELDWEHLPHVHAFAFESITLNKADRNGWDANVVLRDGQAMRMTVALDADRLGYTNATFDADGTENGRTVCRITPGKGDHCTMHLRFFVPDRPNLDKPAVGKFYSDLWARLIDEDEPKMIHRARALKEGATLHKQRRQVTLADGTVCDVPLVCPHQGLPLNCEPDSDNVMTCPWHGYRFDAQTGQCVTGQIKGWINGPADNKA
ncbi:Rieske (2Fe-2S) protein [Sphingorhabdus sp.]|uniref:Rieske (2Fe-2S) protein n=1 Tax=Sphingorhabdus sp. TaxID=1902408 RepID=UPI0032B881DD